MLLPVALLLIAGLASDDFATREACQEALALCPELADPLLWHHYADPEVEHRLQVLRQDCEPLWLLGTWNVHCAGGSLAYRYIFLPHGKGIWCVVPGSERYPFTWHWRPGQLTLMSEGRCEVYHLRPRQGWPGPLLKDTEYSYRLVKPADPGPGHTIHARMHIAYLPDLSW